MDGWAMLFLDGPDLGRFNSLTLFCPCRPTSSSPPPTRLLFSPMTTLRSLYAWSDFLKCSAAHNTVLLLQAEKITALTSAAGAEVEPIWATLLAKALEGKNLKDLLSNVGAGGAAPAAGAPAAAAAGGAGDAPAEEEKKEEEKEESDDDMVRISCFSGSLLLTRRCHRASVCSTSFSVLLSLCYPRIFFVAQHACMSWKSVIRYASLLALYHDFAKKIEKTPSHACRTYIKA